MSDGRKWVLCVMWLAVAVIAYGDPAAGVIGALIAGFVTADAV